MPSVLRATGGSHRPRNPFRSRTSRSCRPIFRGVDSFSPEPRHYRGAEGGTQVASLLDPGPLVALPQGGSCYPIPFRAFSGVTGVAGRLRQALLGLALLALAGCDLSAPQTPALTILLPSGSLHRFSALSDSLQLRPFSLTHLSWLKGGQAGQEFTFASGDTSVVSVSSTGLIRAVANGSTTVVVRGAGATAAGSLAVVVQQEVDSLAVILADTASILTLDAGSRLPLTCKARDHNGFLLPNAPMVQSHAGLVAGELCSDLSVLHSGLDTLTIAAGSVAITLPLAIALPPTVDVPDGYPVPVDIPPAGQRPWAPTLVRGPQGELDLYFGNYIPDSTSPIGARGDLARYVSRDGGVSFQFDGTMLARDSLPCSPNGDGIENVAIAPRADAPGYRMYYSSGGFTCYGWQVFSAVSTDERTWTKEPGVRLSNGGPLPPAPPAGPYEPTGEGMWVDRLPSGEWRMISGTVVPASGSKKFQITEWRSADQLNWSYLRTLLTTDDVGPDAERSIYSPTIREFAPGLFRMLFTGDNRDVYGGLSRIYSSVSTDMVHWQLEGVLLRSSTSNLFYSSLVDDVLVFIRQDPGVPVYLAMARVQMP